MAGHNPAVASRPARTNFLSRCNSAGSPFFPDHHGLWGD
jgi:hypothetical protein